MTLEGKGREDDLPSVKGHMTPCDSVPASLGCVLYEP